MTDTSNDGELDLLAVLPRLSQLGTVLNRSRLIERATESAGLGLDRPGLGVLVSLQTGGGPLRVGEIAKRMQVVGPHVTRHVNELERRGLVQRVPDPDDRRARLVELTPPAPRRSAATCRPCSAPSAKPSPTGLRRTAAPSAACWTASPPT
ncbi:MarR family winged helix-turn-helix transcriptional regulator [Actinoplanes sp. CA-252034]|uniref:MarR family winged helix-turn-helix transcriptional regulator n=1 Tax=Actinoplanes sp. CA-252034 TaxID=3239906 RepID=UPI003D96925F